MKKKQNAYVQEMQETIIALWEFEWKTRFRILSQIFIFFKQKVSQRVEKTITVMLL